MNKIVSNFYLIKVGGKPSYVGYTNRSIKTRFKEHLRDKDFGDESVELERLGSLAYDFTWDYDLINNYAKEVSDRESELILFYNTQDDVWQKGLGSTAGGQTWANVKYFVKTDRDNPKFMGMSEEDILAYLDTSNRVARYISSFIGRIDNPIDAYMKDFIHHMEDPVTTYTYNFVNHMEDPITYYMRGFVKNMDDPMSNYMKDFVNGMHDPISIYIKNFVNNMDEYLSLYIKHFVGSMDDPVSSYMRDFVHHMDNHVNAYMKSFINHMSNPIDN